MRISEIVKRPDLQIPLFIGALDRKISGMPQTRNLCGDFMEDLTAAVGSAVRLATNGAADYCPDCRRSEVLYYECKSAGINGTVIVYDERLKADEAFCIPQEAEHYSGASLPQRALYYWIWRHDLSIKGIRYRDELRQKLASAIKFGVLLPLPIIAEEARRRSLKLLNNAYTKDGKRLGYGKSSNRLRYGYGYSIPVNALKARCNTTILTKPVDIGGICLPSLPVWTLDRSAFLLEDKSSWRNQYHLW